MDNKSEDIDGLLRLYKADPDDMDTGMRLAQCYTDQGWENEALSFYEDLVKRFGNEYSLLLEYGNLLHKRQMNKKAKGVFRKLTVIKPRRIEGWNNLGIEQMTLGEYDAARESFERVLRLDSTDSGAHLNLGNYYDIKGDIEKSLKYFRSAVSIKPDFCDAWFNLGNACLKKGENSEAVEAYKKALRINREFFSAMKNMGYALEQNGDLDGAEEYYLKALKKNRTDASLYLNLGNIFPKRKNIDKARDYYDKAVKISPREAAAWMGIRDVSLLKGDINTYVKSTIAVIKRLGADETAASVARLRTMENYSAAEEIIDRADENNRQSAELDAERVLAYARRNSDKNKVKALLKKLYSLPEKSDHVLYCIALYEFWKKNYDRVFSLLKEIRNKKVPHLILRFRSLIEAERWKDADTEINEFISFNPDSLEALFLLSRVDVFFHREDEAGKHLMAALESGYIQIDDLKIEPSLMKIYNKLNAEQEKKVKK